MSRSLEEELVFLCSQKRNAQPSNAHLWRCSSVLRVSLSVSGFRIMSSCLKKKAEQQLVEFKNAFVRYSADCGSFPTSQQGIEALFSKPVLDPVPQNWKGPYAVNLSRNNPWGNRIVYRIVSEGAKEEFVVLSYSDDGSCLEL